MKTRLIGSALIATSQLLCAQTQKGNGIISGLTTTNYTWNGPENRKQYIWTPGLSVTVGRFVADNWLAGLSASASVVGVRSISTQANEFQQAQTTAVVAAATPFARRYFAVGPAYSFVGAGLSAGYRTDRQYTRGGPIGSSGVTDQQSSEWSVNPYLEAGINYFVSNRLAVQLSTSASSVPVVVSSLNLGLVYWTGPNQRTGQPETQDNPQTNRGNWLVEGGISVAGAKASSTNNSSSRTTYQFSPSVGYFIGKNTLVGLSVPLMYNRFGASYIHGWSVGISPYYQHYWTDTRLTPYTQLGLAYDVYGYGQKVFDSRTWRLEANVSLGLAYMAGKRFIIETSLLATSLSRLHSGGVSDDNVLWNTSLSAGLRGNFAVRYVLTRPR